MPILSKGNIQHKKIHKKSKNIKPTIKRQKKLEHNPGIVVGELRKGVELSTDIRKNIKDIISEYEMVKGKRLNISDKRKVKDFMNTNRVLLVEGINGEKIPSKSSLVFESDNKNSLVNTRAIEIDKLGKAIISFYCKNIGLMTSKNEVSKGERPKHKVKDAVVAFGGNAFSGNTYDAQMASLRKMLMPVAEMINKGINVTVTHGNGPQVGEELLKNMYGSENGLTDKPMDVYAASTQGQLGYAIQQNLGNILKEKHNKKNVKMANLVTEVQINPDDPKSKKPVKPIGPWYTKQEAEKIQKEHPDWIIEKRINSKSDVKVYRRVVVSPIPTGFTNIEALKMLKDNQFVVIASGGGGIPVIYNKNGTREGVAGVIDKDRAAAKLANELKSDTLVILTNVPNVAINFKKPNQKNLTNISPVDALQYDYRKHFEAGSMKPKVESGIDFINNGGKKVIITDGENLNKALENKAGTVIESDKLTELLLNWKKRFIQKKRNKEIKK